MLFEGWNSWLRSNGKPYSQRTYVKLLTETLTKTGVTAMAGTLGNLNRKTDGSRLSRLVVGKLAPKLVRVERCVRQYHGTVRTNTQGGHRCRQVKFAACRAFMRFNVK